MAAKKKATKRKTTKQAGKQKSSSHKQAKQRLQKILENEPESDLSQGKVLAHEEEAGGAEEVAVCVEVNSQTPGERAVEVLEDEMLVASATGPSAGVSAGTVAVPAVALSLGQWRQMEAELVQLQDAMKTSDWERSLSLGQQLLQQFRTMGDQQTIQRDDEPPLRRSVSPDVLPELHHFDEFGACPETQRRARPFLQFLANRYFRIRCYGVENIPVTEPVVLVANHSGVLPYDALMLRHMISEKSSFGRSVRPLVEDLFYHSPFLGPMLYRLGCVRANRENAQRLLSRGEAIVVFPEGYKGLGKSYSQRYRLRRFGRGGFIKLALRAGVPLLPVAVVGAEEVHPVLGKLNLAARALGVPFFPITPTFPLLGPLGLLPFPSPWTIRFGSPIHLPHTAREANDSLLINQLVEEFRQKLQGMVDLLLEERTG